jgi:hypothetical protein
MKKKQTKKLVLAKETVQRLELIQVQGGAATAFSCDHPSQCGPERCPNMDSFVTECP